MMGITKPPLRIPYDLITDIADRADTTPYGRMVYGDLQFIGIEGIASGNPGIFWKPHIERLNAFLTDVSPEATARILARVRACNEGGAEISKIMVDPVTRDLIEERGCSVAAVALLYRMADQVTVTADDLGDDRIRVHLPFYYVDGTIKRRLNLETDLGGGVTWHSNRLELQGEIPETLATSIVGRRLRDIVSHPVLDRHHMTVTECDEGVIHIETKAPHTSAFA